jgi:predicted transcriptional regulator
VAKINFTSLRTLTSEKQFINQDENKGREHYSIWEFGFRDIEDYNSIELLKSAKFEIKQN